MVSGKNNSILNFVLREKKLTHLRSFVARIIMFKNCGYIMSITLLICMSAQANNANYLQKSNCTINIFHNFKSIETERLIIRQFKETDCDSMFAMMSDPEVINQTIALVQHIDRSQTQELLNAILATYGEDLSDWSVFAITDKITGISMGYCGFYAYAPLFNRAEIGYALAKEHWGKGIVPEACKALVVFGIEQCGLNRIEATVYPENKGSIRVCEKLGMKQEGILRKHVMREGHYRDRLLMALLKEDWK